MPIAAPRGEHLLVLGGTSEASALVAALADRTPLMPFPDDAFDCREPSVSPPPRGDGFGVEVAQAGPHRSIRHQSQLRPLPHKREEADRQTCASTGSGIAITLSLAGRTASPRPAPVPTRTGGFGGVEGLALWIAENGVTRVVDATHPFAAQISRNAASACARSGTPLLRLRRPAWEQGAGDRWIEVADMAAAADALGPVPRRVFLTIGRQELAAFARAPHHAYHARMIEPPGDVRPPRLTVIRARGPFPVEDEQRFLREEDIEILVSKNAGGAAACAKIAAARTCGLPVVMVRRPAAPDVETVETVDAVLAWLRAAHTDSLRP